MLKMALASFCFEKDIKQETSRRRIFLLYLRGGMQLELEREMKTNLILPIACRPLLQLSQLSSRCFFFFFPVCIDSYNHDQLSASSWIAWVCSQDMPGFIHLDTMTFSFFSIVQFFIIKLSNLCKRIVTYIPFIVQLLQSHINAESL